jgi:hypothetical protein
LLTPGFRVHDGGHEPRFEVVDVPGDPDVLRDLLGPQNSFDIGPDRAGRVEDGCVGQSSLVGADPLGEAVAQFVVGEEGGAAIGVVNDRDLEVPAFWCLGVDQVAGVGDVPDDGRGDPAPMLRCTRASPSLIPRVCAGSIRQSMQVTM